MLILDQFGIIQNPKTYPISQTSFLVGTFFATSYSKTALNSQHLSNSNILQKGFTFHCCRMLVDDLCFSRDSEGDGTCIFHEARCMQKHR